MKKGILVALIIASIIVLSAGCLGSEQTTTTKTLIKTNTVTKTTSVTYHITHISTQTLVLFTTKTYVKTETISYPVITTVYISGSSTSIGTTHDTFGTSIVFTNVNNVIMQTTNNIVLIKVPYEVQMFSNELSAFTGELNLPFNFDNYPRLVYVIRNYTLTPGNEPTSSGSYIELGFFMGKFASDYAKSYGKVTIVKLFANNIFVDEYVAVNNTYYGKTMAYGVFQFQGYAFSKYGIVTAKMLIMDADGIPLAYNKYTITTGTLKTLNFDGASGKIDGTNFTVVNNVILITITKTTKRFGKTSTEFVTTQPSQGDLEFVVFTANITPDYEILGSREMFRYIYPNDNGVVDITLIHLNGKMYNIMGTVYKYPIGEETFTGSILLKS